MKTFAKLSFFIIGFILLLSSKINGEYTVERYSDENVLDSWKEMDKTATKMAGSAIKMILPQLMESVNKLNISTTCAKQSLLLISGVRRLKIWAVKFVDASSKMIDGMLSGTLSSLGVYDQCLDAYAPAKEANKPPLFRGQYCQIDISPPLPEKSKRFKFQDRVDQLENFTGSELVNFLAQRANYLYSYPYKVGLCVPSGCSAHEINQFIKIMADKLYWQTKVSFCDIKKDTEELPKTAIAAMVVLLFLSATVLLATLFELYTAQKGVAIKSTGSKYLLTFSAISNFKQLFSTKPSVKDVQCLDGIKFLSISMVAMSYSYLCPLFMINAYQSILNVITMMRYPMGQMILNSGVVVDTFYFLIGFLASYQVLKHVKIGKEKFSFRLFFLCRFWKLAPVYYAVILVAFLIPLMGSGPLFKEAMKLSVDNCYNYWWRNLLFINNFFLFEDMCYMHTWFLSCDFQLYLSSLIVLFPIMRSQKMGITINVFIILLSIVYTGIMTYIYDLIPGINIEYLDKSFNADSVLKTYANPVTHAGPYFIGILVGYTLIMKPVVKIPKKYQVVGWCIAALCAGYTMFWTALWKHYTPSPLEISVYASLYRITWATAVAWMVFCCMTGHGGIINSFLTWKAWVPLANLSVLIYLILPIFQILYIGVFKSTHEFTHLELVVTYFGLLVMSGLLALVGHILIESPLLAIEKVFRGKTDIKKDFELPSCNGVHTNGGLKVDTKRETEMEELSNNKNEYMDNKAFEKAL